MLPHCAVLEWLSLTDCFMPSFTMSEPLDHLQYACIQNCSLQSMELHAPNLTVFNYSEQDVPIVLGKFHKLTKAKIEVLSDSDNLDYTFSHLVRAMSNVEEISLRIHIENEARQFMTDSRCDFINLRHLSIEVLVDGDPGCSSGILRLASLLELTPSLEVFNLHQLFSLVALPGSGSRAPVRVVEKAMQRVDSQYGQDGRQGCDAKNKKDFKV